jgi:membrane protein implicated in regulation of membrane protease activity
MNRSHWVDIGAALSYIAGGGLAAGAVAAGTLFPKYSTQIIAWSVVAVSLAGLLRLFFNRTGSAATSVVQNAPVVNASGQEVAKTVSTTSTLPIMAPTSGGIIPKP